MNLEDLSYELKSEILHFSTDVDSLKALVQASPSFYEVYKEMRSSVLNAVVARDIHPDILVDALAVVHASRITPRTSDQVRSFLRYYSTNRHKEPVKWLPNPLLVKLGSFHQRYVEAFAKEFVSWNLEVHPVSQEPQAAYRSPSLLETRRIHRSIYRFELYCILFGQKRDVQHEDDMLYRWYRLDSFYQKELFLMLYPPWEVEELYCIHDYHYWRLSVPFGEVARHDLRMGALGIGSEFYQGNRFPNGYMEYFLGGGLAFLHALLHSSSYEERTELIMGDLFSDSEFFVQAIEQYRTSRNFKGATDVGVVIDFRGDDSDAPNKAWLWANNYTHTYNTRPYFPDNRKKADLRLWGYCMWDSQRLSDWGLLQVPYKYPFSKTLMERLRDVGERRWEETLRTERPRAEAFARGGRGYWTQDESQLTWINRTQPQPPVTERKSLVRRVLHSIFGPS